MSYSNCCSGWRFGSLFVMLKSWTLVVIRQQTIIINSAALLQFYDTFAGLAKPNTANRKRLAGENSGTFTI